MLTLQDSAMILLSDLDYPALIKLFTIQSNTRTNVKKTAVYKFILLCLVLLQLEYE